MQVYRGQNLLKLQDELASQRPSRPLTLLWRQQTSDKDSSKTAHKINTS